MRSSVAETSSSSHSEVRGQRYQTQYQSRMPNPQRSPSKSTTITKRKRRLVLAPAEGWLPMLLLAVAIYCVVFSITAVGWANNTFILNWSGIIGLIVGLVVAKLDRLPQAILHVAACLIGHWLSIWLTSVFAFHIPWIVLISNIGAVIIDPGGMSNNQMVFLFYLSFLSFFLGYFGAWLIYRAHLPWLVAIVYCSILLINLSYAPPNAAFVLAILLPTLILLIARVQLTAQVIQWKYEGLYTDRPWLRGITWRCMRVTSVLVVLTLLLGWLLPVLSQPEAGTTFWDYLDNIWSNTLQGHLSLQDPGSMLRPYETPTNFFGDQLTIAGSVHLPAGEVLHYTSTAAPQYLAGFTYDHFDGHTWTSLSATSSQNYNANEQLPNDTRGKYRTATTSVTLVQPPGSSKNYIFGPTQPSEFDVSTTVYGDTILSAWAQQSALSTGEHYEVKSLLSTASPDDLSTLPLPQDNSDIWKTDPNYTILQALYVQVPANLSPEVWQTTQQWTRGATNTYEALLRLEAHLSDQTEFTYSLDNPPVPNNVDAASWLLQTHRGYCTYYATTMTIMARQLGIPTRIVNGFSHGHLDTHRQVWMVNGSDAHSWVQAYFPNFGWINFDPTPGFALNGSNTHPTASPTATPHPTKPVTKGTPVGKKKGSHPNPTPVSQRGSSQRPGTVAGQRLLVGLTIAALLISLLVLLLAIANYWWRNLYADSSFVARTFWRFCRIASWVGFSPQSWQTPYEYSRQLCRRVPQEAPSVWRLTELFVRERWAPPHQVSTALRDEELKQLWPSLHKVLLRLLWLKTQKH